MTYISIPTIAIVGLIAFTLVLISQVFKMWFVIRAKNAVWIEKYAHKRPCGQMLSMFRTERMNVLFNGVRRDGCQFYLMQDEDIMCSLQVKSENVDATERYFSKYGYFVSSL